MNIIFNKEKAQMEKARFESIFKLEAKKIQLEEESNLLHEIGWAIPVLMLSYFAILYGFRAEQGWIALICVLLNLIVPSMRIVEAIQKYCWLIEFIKSGRLKKDTAPPIVLYNDALETLNNVDLYLEFDPLFSPNRKCHVYLDTHDNKTPVTENHVGNFDILIDPTVQETTVDLENETVIIPSDNVECNRSEEEND